MAIDIKNLSNTNTLHMYGWVFPVTHIPRGNINYGYQDVSHCACLCFVCILTVARVSDEQIYGSEFQIKVMASRRGVCGRTFLAVEVRGSEIKNIPVGWLSSRRVKQRDPAAARLTERVNGSGR